MNLWNDKVIRAMFAFALGVVLVVLQFASEDPNKFLIGAGVVWCVIALYWTVREIKADWQNP